MTVIAPFALLCLLTAVVGAGLGWGASVLVWPITAFVLSGPIFGLVTLAARAIPRRTE